MRRFLVDGKEYFCPRDLEQCKDWRTVTYVMAYQFANYVYLTAREKVKMKVALLCDLTGLPQQVINKLTPKQVERLLSMIAWVKYAKIEDKKPFEFFEFGGEKYYLPSENLADTSAIEMAMLTIYFMAYSKESNPNKEAIFNIVASVCRPERDDIVEFRKSSEWSNDVRELYNSAVADARAVEFRKLPQATIMVVYLYVSEMLQKFWKRYDDLLDGNNEEALYEHGEGQITMLMDIAEMNVFGDFKNVCMQNVHTIYMFLRDKKLKVDRANRSKTEDDDE